MHRGTTKAQPSHDEYNTSSGLVVDCSMKVQSVLGPGLLESTYHCCLAHELRKRGARVQSHLYLPVAYDGIEIDAGYRLDMLVNDLVIVELKAVMQVHPIHEAQVLSYMKLSLRRVGLLINFNVVHLKDGIKRFAL